MKFNDLKSVKDYLRKQPPLKIGGGFVLKDKNPKDFVRNFILRYNVEHTTVYDSNGQTQTRRNACRSASDIFIVTKFYFPRVRIKTVYQVILDLLLERKIQSSICSTVCKRVYYVNTYPYQGTQWYGVPTDECKIDWEKEFPDFKKLSREGDDSTYLTYFNIPKIS